MDLLCGIGGLALIAPAALVPLRSRSATAWWSSCLLAAIAISLAVVAVTPSTNAWKRSGIVLLYVLPLMLLFLTMRSEVFAERRYLIAVVGPFVLVAGFLVALSCAVTLGMLQP